MITLNRTKENIKYLKNSKIISLNLDSTNINGKLSTKYPQLTFFIDYCFNYLPSTLQAISLKNTKDFFSGLIHIATNCPDIKSIDLSYSLIVDDLIIELFHDGGCSKLERLDLSHCRYLTTDGVVRIGG